MSACLPLILQQVQLKLHSYSLSLLHSLSFPPCIPSRSFRRLSRASTCQLSDAINDEHAPLPPLLILSPSSSLFSLGRLQRSLIISNLPLSLSSLSIFSPYRLTHRKEKGHVLREGERTVSAEMRMHSSPPPSYAFSDFSKRKGTMHTQKTQQYLLAQESWTLRRRD